MERMGIDDKLIRLTKQLYKNPMFCVEMDEQISSWKTKKTGIRQGCTLSPYLFLILMTTVMHDVHDNPELDHELKNNRPINHDIDEVLYADDTILCSTNAKTVEKLLHRIEDIGRQYGLHLNKDKCDAISTNEKAKGLKFKTGEAVTRKTEAKYLGCKINYKADIDAELNKRISETNLAWKSLEIFWKHGLCDEATRIRIYDSVIRSKLLYGLNTAHLTKARR